MQRRIVVFPALFGATNKLMLLERSISPESPWDLTFRILSLLNHIVWETCLHSTDSQVDKVSLTVQRESRPVLAGRPLESA